MHAYKCLWWDEINPGYFLGTSSSLAASKRVSVAETHQNLGLRIFMYQYLMPGNLSNSEKALYNEGSAHSWARCFYFVSSPLHQKKHWHFHLLDKQWTTGKYRLKNWILSNKHRYFHDRKSLKKPSKSFKNSLRKNNN